MSLANSEQYSVDGMNELETSSDFDADVVFANGIDVFDGNNNENVVDEKCDKNYPDLNVSLR